MPKVLYAIEAPFGLDPSPVESRVAPADARALHKNPATAGLALARETISPGVGWHDLF